MYPNCCCSYGRVGIYLRLVVLRSLGILGYIYCLANILNIKNLTGGLSKQSFGLNSIELPSHFTLKNIR